MNFGVIIPILGIITWVLLLTTALIGLSFKKKRTPKKVLVHKTLAITALSLATIHGGIVLYTKFFL